MSYSHTDDDIDRAIEAIDGALSVYAEALEDAPEHSLVWPGRAWFTFEEFR